MNTHRFRVPRPWFGAVIDLDINIFFFHLMQLRNPGGHCLVSLFFGEIFSFDVFPWEKLLKLGVKRILATFAAVRTIYVFSFRNSVFAVIKRTTLFPVQRKTGRFGTIDLGSVASFSYCFVDFDSRRWVTNELMWLNEKLTKLLSIFRSIWRLCF